LLKIILSVVVVVIIVYMFINNKNMKTYRSYMKRKTQLEESINNFNATQSYANQNVVIAINDQEEKICISTMKNGLPVPLEYKFDQIIASEVQENGVTLAAVSRPGQFGGEISGVQTTSDGAETPKLGNEAERIDLKISFNDSQNPYVLANFLYWRISRKSEDYKKALEEAYKWHGIMENIIKGGKS